MKHVSLAFMAAVALASLVGMVTLVTAAVSAPANPTPLYLERLVTPTIALTQAVDNDTDPVEHVIVLGVYPAADASAVQHFTYQTIFLNRKACQEFKDGETFTSSMQSFLVIKSLEMGPVGWTVRCLAKGTPT